MGITMTKYYIRASEIVYFTKEIEADNEDQAWEKAFDLNWSNDDLVNRRDFTIEEVEESAND